MANERVSQLTDLFASDIQPNDLFLVTDMSQRESKRMEVGQLLLFIESSGSFFAYHATTADTASYVKSSNIDGIVAESSLSTQSLSASFANTSISSSHASTAVTASYSQFCVISQDTANSASYLIYSGFPNGTASYSLLSNTSNVTTTALNLFYNGTPNGTASFAMTASFAESASYATQSSHADIASLATTASFAKISNNSNTSSISDTASVALIANYLTQNVGPKFITPIVIKNTTSAVDWTVFNCPTNIIPIGTNVVILDCWSTQYHSSTIGFIEISPSSNLTGSPYVLLGCASQGAGSGTTNTVGGQGTFPCSSSLWNSSSFYYTFTESAIGGTTLRLIGYY